MPTVQDDGPYWPRDCDGREIRPGFIMESADAPASGIDFRYSVQSYGRYIAGELDAYWLVMITAPEDGDTMPWARRADTLRVVQPASNAPEHGTTDEILHRLRELVAARQTLAERTGLSVEDAAGDSGEWANLFDELDYRMSRRGYVLPGAWGEAR